MRSRNPSKEMPNSFSARSKGGAGGTEGKMRERKEIERLVNKVGNRRALMRGGNSCERSNWSYKPLLTHGRK